MKRVWLLVPAIIGLFIAALLTRLPAVNRVFSLRLDLAMACSLAAIIVSLVLGVGVFALNLIETKHQQKLRQLEAKMVEDRHRFLRRLDHEMKNPLTAIQAGLSNLAEELNGTGHEAFDTIQIQSRRLSRLIADLRKVADLETRALEWSAVDIPSLLRDAVIEVQEQYGDNGKRLKLTLMELPWPLPSIRGDADLLLLALHNLLDNALKFSQPDTPIEVRAYENGKVVFIEVADGGLGIPEKEISHVWEELYRGEAARGIVGSGIGLALVRTIIRRHGGQIAIRSRVGQGTIVGIRLPIR